VNGKLHLGVRSLNARTRVAVESFGKKFMVRGHAIHVLSAYCCRRFEIWQRIGTWCFREGTSCAMLRALDAESVL
jgi:hypothetical protein